MGDDLGDDWAVEGLDAGDEGASSAAAAPVAPKATTKSKNKDAKKKKKKGSSSGGGGGGGGGDTPADDAALAGRKRGRMQLSPEGFEESDGEGEGTGDEQEEEDNEESRLKAAEEEEAKLRRAEKKREKIKALKVRVKEAKKRRIAEDAAAAAAAAGGVTVSVGDQATAATEAEELWAQFCKVRGNLVTPLELDLPWITGKSLAGVDGFGAHTTIKLAGFIKASLPQWKKRIQNRDSNAPRGSPYVLIVCVGARRCVEVMKHLTAFRCQVVKLFAKHLKIEEQKVMLKKACFPIGVGTPGRMRALAEAGSLRLDSSALVVLDLEKNIKGRNVLDMDGVSGDTMAFLADCVRPHLTRTTSATPSSSSGSGKKKDGGKGGGRGQGQGAKTAVEGSGQLRIALY